MFPPVLTLHTTQQHLYLAGLEQSGLMFHANQSDDFHFYLLHVCHLQCNYHKFGSQVST